LIYSTYLGGSNQSFGQGIAVDAAGDASVTGYTLASDFPLVDAIQATCSGLAEGSDAAFVVQINPAGTALLYSTFLGCSDDQEGINVTYNTIGNGIAADSSGNIYVTGNTGVTNFPVSNPLQPTLHGSSNAFIVKISPAMQAPWVSLSSISLPFGAQAVNTTSPPLSETVTNGGKTALIISGVTIGGANASDFAVSADNCTGATVAPNGSCAVSVTFTPPAAGNRNAQLAFADNASNSPQAVALSGAAGASGPVAVVTPSSLDFSEQNVLCFASRLVTLKNTGNAPLVISTLVTSPNFDQTNDCEASIAGGSSCTINVTASPAAAGPFSGTLTVIDNSKGVTGSVQSVELSGAFQDFTLATTSPASLTVEPGSTATYTLSLAGLGGFNQNVGFACTAATASASCTVSPNPVSVGSAPTYVTVTVTTTAPSSSPPRLRRLLPIPPLAPGSKDPLILFCLLAALAWVTRRRKQRCPRSPAIAPVALGLCLTLLLAACGGVSPKTPNAGTPPATTYFLSVEGTAGSGACALSHVVTLTLTVT